MRILVDTSIWSAALRRTQKAESTSTQELRHLVTDHRVELIGPIRQEILSGIREKAQFEKLERHLAAFPDVPVLTEDYVTASTFFNLCRSKGIQGSNTDFLICSVAVRCGYAIYTTDKDFESYASLLPISLHPPD